MRFTGCNLRCRFCDTERAFPRAEACALFDRTGKKQEISLANPPKPEDLLNHLKRLDSPPIHPFLSFTGGEPLLHSSYLARILPRVKERLGIKVLLETNGTLASRLKEILPWVDLISMDLKIPSSTGERDLRGEHSSFLKAAGEKDLYCKVVLTDRFRMEELGSLLSLPAERPLPLVLQPVSPVKEGVRPPSSALLLEAQERLSAAFHPVRIIPQIHPLLGIP